MTRRGGCGIGSRGRSLPVWRWMTAGSISPVLTYWRSRLRRSARPERIFEAVREVISVTGVLAGKTRRALDSTLLDDAVATQDTVTQLISAIRRARRQIPAAVHGGGRRP